MRGLFAVPVLFAIATVLPAACGGDDGEVAGSRDTTEPELEDVVALEGDRVEVTALDNTFNHQNIRIAAGTTVVWENKGRQNHDVIPADADADSWGVGEEEFTPGDVYEYTFEEPGTYRYYCSLHGDPDAGMIGAIVVEEPTSSAGDDQQADVQDNNDS